MKKLKEFLKKVFNQAKNFFSRSWYWFKSLSVIKHILITYFLITIIGSLLLFTDQAHNSGQSTTYLDSLFVAASAFSDTGLSSVNTAQTWSIFGQAVIALLILIGGVGWFALKVYLINVLFDKKLSFWAKEILTVERGSGKMGVSKRIIKISISIMLIIIIIASIALTLYFYYVPGQMGGYDVDNLSKQNNTAVFKNVQWNDSFYGTDPSGNWSLSIRYGVFHSISAINNAGFDIVGGHSFMGYYHNYGVQIIFIMLFVIGGIGYPVIFDIYLWAKSKVTKEQFRWSLFTKLSMLTYVLLTIIGILLVMSIEIPAQPIKAFNGTKIPSFWSDQINGSKTDKAMALIFNTMSTRNAGFSTIRMGELTSATLIVYIILMFIGSAPSSTAGGIRTTTLAIIFMGLYSKLKHSKNVNVFNRRIPIRTVRRAFVVFFIGTFLVVGVSIIVITSLASSGGQANADYNAWNPVYIIPESKLGTGTHATVIAKKFNFTDIIFEVGSAFGTTGLSTGITGYLSMVSKIFIIFVMFIGQMGISSSILVWGNRRSPDKHYSYVEEDVATG